MLRVPILMVLGVLLSLPAYAAEEEPAGPALQFGMSLEDTNKQLADEEVWRIAYRIDTPSTAEIACVWQDTVTYLVKFYEGECIYVEKRAHVPLEEIALMMARHNDAYGESKEAAQSTEGRLVYSRWSTPRREISIYAIRGPHGEKDYKLIYEEYDPLAIGDHRVAQERELRDRADAEEDPLTGHVRVNPLGSSAEGPDDPNAPEDEGAED